MKVFNNQTECATAENNTKPMENHILNIHGNIFSRQNQTAKNVP